MRLDIVGKYKLYFAIPIVILLVAAIMWPLVGGPRMGIDFTGGTMITMELNAGVDQDKIAAAADAAGLSDYSVASTGERGAVTQAVVRLKESSDAISDEELATSLLTKVQEDYPEATLLQTERVGAIAGADLVKNAAYSIGIASILLLIYIWIRFEAASGTVAIITSVLNVAVMLAFMVILRSFIQLNSSFIAAALTIVGYSINNTIIILDRIRENTKLQGTKNRDYFEIANKSVVQSLGRTVNTTFTSLITLVILYVLGVEAIREFIMPLIIGMISGVYVSIFIVPYLWARLTMAFAGRKAGGKKSKGRSGARVKRA